MTDLPDVQGEEFGRDADLGFDPAFILSRYAFDPALVADPQALANRIVRDIDCWEADMNAIRDRWDRNEAIYRADPAYVGAVAIDGMEPVAVPLSRIKCDNTTSTTASAFFASEPYASIEAANEPEVNAQRERANTKLAKECKLERTVSSALWCAWLYNLGAVHIAPVIASDEAGGYRLSGIQSAWIDPRNLCIYPSAESDAWRCRTVGRRFYEPLWECERRMQEGTWFPCNIAQNASVRQFQPQESPTPMGEPSYTQRDDEAPELWEVETWHRAPSGRWVRLQCTVCRNPVRLLRVDLFDLPVSQYATFRYVDNEQGLITKDSIGQATQGLGSFASDAFTNYGQIAQGKATPIVAMIGGSLGPDRIKRVQWGEVWDDLDPGTEIQVINPGGDISDLAGALEKVEQWFDAVTGVSRTASNQQLPSGTTATAINALAQSDARGQSRMMDVATDGFEQALRIIDALWIKEYHRWVTLYGESAVGTTDIASVRSQADVVSTARAVGSPQTLLQKLQALWEMSKDPASGLDPSRVAYHIVQALDLPFDPEDVKAQMLGGVPLEALVAGMGGGAAQSGFPGVPGAPVGPAEPNPGNPGEPVA